MRNDPLKGDLSPDANLRLVSDHCAKSYEQLLITLLITCFHPLAASHQSH